MVLFAVQFSCGRGLRFTWQFLGRGWSALNFSLAGTRKNSTINSTKCSECSAAPHTGGPSRWRLDRAHTSGVRMLYSSLLSFPNGERLNFRSARCLGPSGRCRKNFQPATLITRMKAISASGKSEKFDLWV